MADVQYENFALNSANNAFSGVWKLSRALKKAGATYKASSDGSAKDTTGTATNDKWGGNADPSADSYPSGLDSVAAWWNAQLVTTIKLSMTSAPTGTFIRGETVTQATSGAEGEFLGFTYDSLTTTGHAVILPRTGTFDASHVVTGGISAATFTPTALKTCVREVVIWKTTNTTQGSLYLQCIINEDENASRFSVLAGGAAGCTATVAPGGGGTGNSFPTAGSYILHGVSTPTHTNWWQVSTNLGKAQIIVPNMVSSTGVSPDGSFIAIVGDTQSGTQAQMFGYFRMDDHEGGDLDPFCGFHSTSTSPTAGDARTNSPSSGNLSNTSFFTGIGGGTHAWKGWRRRGFPSADAFTTLTGEYLFDGVSTGGALGNNTATPETEAHSYAAAPPRVREKVVLVSSINTLKVRKGSPRHIRLVQGASTFDTFDTKTRMVVALQTGANSPGSVLVGKFDGTTTPTQA